MKNYLILIFVLSLSLVGSVSNSYADFAVFLDSFDGSDGEGIEFEIPLAVAVDLNNNIIVSDDGLNTVQIYDSAGSFITSFDGSDGEGIAFVNPGGIAVDSANRIIVADTTQSLVQIYNSNGIFDFAIHGTDTTAFDFPNSVAVDNNNRIIVGDFAADEVLIFSSTGTFDFIIDGTVDGATPFVDPYAVAVDSENRIIVAERSEGIVQIFNSDGSFVTSFDGTDGGIPFVNPYAVAVDSENRILVADALAGKIQIFTPNGYFVDSFEGLVGDARFTNPIALAVDDNDRIIVIDVVRDLVQIFGAYTADEDGTGGEETQPPIEENGTGAGEESDDDKGSGGCNDCTSPTLGLNKYFVRVVDYGFSYNGNTVQVEKWHTPFPLITATVGEMNRVEIIVYENGGVNNMALVQFGLGASYIGEPLNDLEVLIEVWLDPFGNNGDPGAIGNFSVEKIIIKDRDNLIDTFTVFAVVDVVKCQAISLDERCLKVTLDYSYREATINNVMVVNVVDKPRNDQNFFFNDGVEVVGESLNVAPTYELFNRQLKQQTEDLTLTLTRTDKVNHIWVDNYGIEYLHVSADRFDRLTPHTPTECTDPPLDEINVPTRKNCNFRALTSLWSVE